MMSAVQPPLNGIARPAPEGVPAGTWKVATSEDIYVPPPGARRRRMASSGSLDMKVLGMNSGTAMDGIDMALVHYRQETPDSPLHMELLKVGDTALEHVLQLNIQYDEIAVPQWIKRPVLKVLQTQRTTPSDMSQLNVDLGIMFGDAVKEFCCKHNIPITDIDLIGSHGQTIWLLSRPKEAEIRSAFCLGEGTVMVSLATPWMAILYPVHLFDGSRS